jgi:hypothetical protein
MEVQVQLTQTNIQRFERKVDRRQPGECWPWTGARNPKGYGQFNDGIRFHTASRFAWAIANKSPFPADLLACHSCDNPPCCNPAHIWPGTHTENMQDAAAKGSFKGAGERLRKGKRTFSTHCPNGHLFSPENTAKANGNRRCITCHREGNKRLHARRMAMIEAFPVLRATLIEIAGNGDGSGRNPQLMVDAAVAALAKIEGLSK